MRALVAGQPRTLAEVTYAVENARGTMPGTVGRVDNAFDALDILDGSEIVLFLEVSGANDSQLTQIRTLMMKGARVIVLCKDVSPELRIAAMKGGAREVLFAPFTPERVHASLSSSVAQTGAIEIGVATDYRAIFLPEASKEQIEARVKSLSTQGLTAETGGARIGRDALLRVAIQAPPPHRLPVLFARCVADGGSGSVTLRFVGVTVDEQTALQQVLRASPVIPASAPVATPSGLRRPSLPPSNAPVMPAGDPSDDDGRTRIGALPAGPVDTTSARAAIGRVIAEIDASVLREAPQKWLGFTLPALTDAERLAMVEETPLADAAVWRTRAHVIASMLEAHPELATSDLPFEDWREGLAGARAIVRQVVTQRMAEGDQGLLRETRDVQARLNAVSDRIDRLAREAGLEVASSGGPLERPAGPATFERPLPPPPPVPDSAAARAATRPGGRRRVYVLAIVVIALGAAAAAIYFGGEARRTRDIGREAIAARPIKTTSAGIRVRSVFREPDRVVAVVDRSWYDLGLQTSRSKAEDAARTLAVEMGLQGRVTIRDFAGRRLVEIDTSAPRDAASAGTATTTPLATSTASDAVPATTAAEPEPSPAVTTEPPAKTPSPKATPRAKKSGRVPASPSR